jgi:hypothetical protein
MTICPCPHCATGTKSIAFVMTANGPLPLFLNKYSSCSCALSPMDKAQLIEQAEAEQVRAS